MIKEIKIEKKELDFREPFEIAYERVEQASVLLLSLEDEKGSIGLGSAAPDKTVTGETVDDLINLLNRRLRPAFFSHPINDRSWYEKKIRQSFVGYPSAQAALETALIHLAALSDNRNPQDYFGTCRAECALVVTVGIMDLPKTLRKVKVHLANGCQTIKLKVGLTPELDIEKILAVRSLMPKNTQLVLDANQGYSYQQTKRVLKAIRHVDILAVEQPVSANQKEEFRKLRAMEIVPLIADEMANTREEARQLLKQGAIDGINVKMMKYGGPSSCREIIEYALEKSRLVMLGCMYESNVSITAAAYLALAYPVQLVDLDSGHFDFDNDPTTAGAWVENGVLRVRGVPELKERNTPQ